MGTAIQVIVGLGNPGPDYDRTRHNAGAWYAEYLARSEGATFKVERKLHGLACQVRGREPYRLLLPTTFMNHSGQAVRAVMDFYKLNTDNILIAHDELDMPAGTIKLKRGGGHGGHNGLRDIIAHLGTQDFLRLRIGIGHPGHRDRVHDYVLGRPSKHDHELIDDAIAKAAAVTPTLIGGDIDKAMRQLHS